jgi:uroporphyrinogen-III synthase
VGLPEGTALLRQAIASIIKGDVHVALFTTGVQVVHLFEIADEMHLCEDLRKAFGRVFVASSIGSSTSEALRNNGISVDLEPLIPKWAYW